MSISRGRPAPEVWSVFFDAVSATPPILPRPTDTRPHRAPDAPRGTPLPGPAAPPTPRRGRGGGAAGAPTPRRAPRSRPLPHPGPAVRARRLHGRGPAAPARDVRGSTVVRHTCTRRGVRDGHETAQG